MSISTTTQQTMLSTEIVKIINDMREEGTAVLAHSDFMKKVVKVLGEEGAGKFSVSYLSAQNKQLPCYALPKREANLMVMSESYKVQAAVYDRMVELEAKPVDPMQVLADPAAMRGLLLTYTEKVIALEETLKQKDSVILDQAPKVAALDKLTLADGSLNITEAAKTLEIQPKKLFTALEMAKWIYRRVGGSSWLGYQDKIQRGYVTHKVTTVKMNDGSEKISEQVRITPKGLTKLATMEF